MTKRSSEPPIRLGHLDTNGPSQLPKSARRKPDNLDGADGQASQQNCDGAIVESSWKNRARGRSRRQAEMTEIRPIY